MAVNRALRERPAGAGRGAHPGRGAAQAPAAVVRLLSSLLEAARATGGVRSLFGENLTLFGAEGQYNVHAVAAPATGRAICW